MIIRPAFQLTTGFLFGVLRLHRGRFADPDLYFWVPHGYGEYRDNSAEEPFMEGDMVNGVMSGIGKFRFFESQDCSSQAPCSHTLLCGATSLWSSSS